MNIELSSTGAAYIRYTTNPSATNVFVGDDEDSDVIADLDECGDVVGIEILDVSVVADIEKARGFARQHELPFPRDLAAAARDVSAV
jgi:uncharacterized protein YuzE